MDGSHNFEEAARLSPEMASRRLQVLAFVRQYLARWGHSPSQNEIAAGLGVARTTVRRALRSLAGEQLLLRTPGQRGLTLPDERDAALRTLEALGWRVLRVDCGGPLSTLIPPGVLDYLPDTQAGEPHDEIERAEIDRAGEGAARAA